MFTVGDRVRVIVAQSGSTWVMCEPSYDGRTAVVIDADYEYSIWPYVVQFEDGYREAFTATELELVQE